MEKFKKHPTLPILVSSTGNIKTIDKKVKDSLNRKYIVKGRLRKTDKNRGGYIQIDIDNTKYRVHRLVAETFIPNTLNKMFVNHLNKNRSDNRVENLEWTTKSENELHKHKGRKRGVVKRGKKFIAQLKYKGKQNYIGTYDNIEDAYKAYYTKYETLTGEKPW
jgi:hypothetical protein